MNEFGLWNQSTNDYEPVTNEPMISEPMISELMTNDQ